MKMQKNALFHCATFLNMPYPDILDNPLEMGRLEVLEVGEAKVVLLLRRFSPGSRDDG
jgi:hypothetical protein